MNRDARELLSEIGIDKIIAPTAVVSSLSVAEQQLVEIAKVNFIQIPSINYG